VGNAAQTQGHLHLATVSPHQKSPLAVLSTPFSPTPQGGHHGSPVQSPVRHLRRADHVRGRRTSGATALREKFPGYPAGSKRFSLTATGDVLGLYHPSLSAAFRSWGHIAGSRSRKKVGSDGTWLVHNTPHVTV